MADPDEGQVSAGPDEGKMSFLDHLGELRTRIVWSLIPAGIGVAVAFYFTDRIIRFLARPITGLQTELVFMAPTEAFWTYMKVAMIAGVFVAMPAVLWNVWAFVSPGLLKHERKYAAPFVLVGSFLFLAGGAFALLVVVPFAVRFLVTFGQGQGLRPVISVSSYVDFVLKFTLAFGVVFELPVVITLLSLMGLVTPQFLSRNRKYAILLSFVVAAILTPTPDILNQSLMAGPLCLLYEVGIVAARVFGRRPRKPAEEPVATSAETDREGPA